MAKSSGRSKALLVVVVILVAAGGWYYFRNGAAKPPEVASVKVTRGEIVQSVTATGDLQPVLTTDVSSQISGQIKEVLVDYNTPVKKGDVLARIDPATYESRLRSAEADLASTQANYTLTRLNTERVRELRIKNLVSQQELDQAEALLAQAEAQLLTRRASVDNAKVDLSRCTLSSPIDGIVIDRLAEVGKMVAASLNAPTLFTIANDLAKMQINAAVAEADIGNIELGQPVNFTVDAFPSRQFRGRVSQIRNLPVTQQNVVVYSTIIDVNNEDLKLKPGMTANVAIVVARRENALRIPNAALRARVPESLLPPPLAAASAKLEGASATPPAAAGDQREQFRAIMREAGFTPGSGPPSPDVMARVRQLAAERGVEVPERFGGRTRSGGGGASPVITRTVYKLVARPPALKIDSVTVKLGITDGSTTEVLEGLSEDDTLVTSVTFANSSSPSRAPSSNPFGGGPRRF
ncbi:MAG TPA: efflux RND transporter periplasmic adaptor subunit [Opitutaceae bacterium]